MEAETTQPTTYLVPEVNYSHLKDQIAKLQRRAAKLGSGEITLTELGHEDWAGWRVLGETDDRVQYFKPGTSPNGSKAQFTGEYRRYFQVQVSGDKPKLNGWQFAATLDATYDEENKFVGNLLRVVPGFELPEVYRTAQADCDHCKASRQRKNTFIVKHENGDWKQIGRQCIKDFLGHASPEQYAKFAEYLMSIGELLDASEDDGWEGGGGGGVKRYSVLSVLEIVSTLVRNLGWKPKSFEEGSTATALSYYLFVKGDAAEKFRRANPVLDADKALAVSTLEWLEGLATRTNLNDYLHNLSLLGRAGAVEPKAFGFLASAVPTYLRSKDVETSRKQEKLVSNWVGAIKEKVEAIVTLKSKFYSEGSYGVQTKCKFIDESGNVIIWWASGTIDLEEGIKVRVRFTVKKHDEYQELKQTLVLRVKVLEVIEPEEKEDEPVCLGGKPAGKSGYCDDRTCICKPQDTPSLGDSGIVAPNYSS